MTGPSEKAAKAAAQVAGEHGLTKQHARALNEALWAAHDPALGPDRSVCLTDVLTWLEGRTGAHGGGFTSADDVRDAIEHEFGGERE